MKGPWVVLLSVLSFVLLVNYPVTGRAEVEGNCTMCHRFPGLGRYNRTENDPKNTDKLIYYINTDLFEASYHGKLRCKNCHTEVDKIPHSNAPAVDCATDCHIIDPSVNRAFSHKKIVSDLNASAHGKEGSRGIDNSDLPVCKDCHNNKTYHVDVEKQNGSEDFTKICGECHQSKKWARYFLEHMFYRSHKRRSSRDVIELCSNCHEDKKLMTKHKLDIVLGFTQTFHAKAISYGNEKVANCLNCHAPYQLGFSPHRIKSWRDESSPVHPSNKIETCRQSGCHAKARKNFAAGGKVHPLPSSIRILGRATNTSLQKMDTAQVLADTIFERKILGWIELFYKILIAGVVGSFIVHRSLEIYSGRRQRKKKAGGH